MCESETRRSVRNGVADASSLLSPLFLSTQMVVWYQGEANANNPPLCQ